MHAYKCVCVWGGAGHMLVCIKVDTKLLWWSARLFIIALALKKEKKNNICDDLSDLGSNADC